VTVYLVRGVIGPKKMEYINKLGAVTIGEDQFFCVNGKYHFDKTKLKAAQDYVKIMLNVLLTKLGIDVVINNTFVKKAWMAPYLDIAKKNNAFVKVVTVNEDTETIHYTSQTTLDWIKLNWED